MKSLVRMLVVIVACLSAATSVNAQSCNNSQHRVKTYNVEGNSQFNINTSGSVDFNINFVGAKTFRDTILCILNRVASLEKYRTTSANQIAMIKKLVVSTDNKVEILKVLDSMRWVAQTQENSELAEAIGVCYRKTNHRLDSLYAIVDTVKQTVDAHTAALGILGRNMTYVEDYYKPKRQAKFNRPADYLGTPMETFKKKGKSRSSMRNDDEEEETRTYHGRADRYDGTRQRASIGFFDREVKILWWRMSPCGIVIRSVVGIAGGLALYDLNYMQHNDTKGDYFAAFHPDSQPTVH